MATTQLPAHAQPGTAIVPAGAVVPAVAAGETSSSAIAAREKAAVEARFLKAMHAPRDFETSRQRLLGACRRPLFAAVARYSKPVGGERIFGLSVRFAEEARVLWGNMDVTTMVVFDDDERRIYRVQGIDLETNAADAIDVIVEKFVERSVVKEGMEVIGSRQNSRGKTVYKVRATEDDMMVKSNAHISKAKRNVILSLLPGDVKEECESIIVGTLQDEDRQDPDAARRKILDAFWKYGVTPVQIGELLGHPAEQMNPAEMTLLRSYGTAIKEGEATWADIVEAHTGGKKKATTEAAAAKGTGTDALQETLAKKRGAPKQESAPAPTETAKASNVCQECGGIDGKHQADCRYFAD